MLLLCLLLKIWASSIYSQSESAGIDWISTYGWCGWASSGFVIIVCSCFVSAVKPRQSRSRLSNPDDSSAKDVLWRGRAAGFQEAQCDCRNTAQVAALLVAACFHQPFILLCHQMHLHAAQKWHLLQINLGSVFFMVLWVQTGNF